jgi:glycosyltransferase involved in cell wall biosynthesis
MSNQSFTISLVVPVYNEEESIDTFIETIDKELAPLRDQLQIVFVNDGSRDKTREVVEKAIERDNRVSLINLARNFGKEAAMTAGLAHARGDAVIPMDVDLQDPPALVLEFVRLWREEGYDTVYGVRTDRNADTAMKRLTAGGFYRFFNAVSTTTKIPENAGDFRLMDRRVVEAINQLPERNRFMKGLFAWAGFRSIGVPYARPERAAGTTKFNYWKLWNFALDGLFSFCWRWCCWYQLSVYADHHIKSAFRRSRQPWICFSDVCDSVSRRRAVAFYWYHGRIHRPNVPGSKTTSGIPDRRCLRSVCATESS